MRVASARNGPADPLPAAHGAPVLSATLSRTPEDFQVHELMDVEHAGKGEHLWLFIEKRLLNSADVGGLLERTYGVGSADVGYSGLKDRRAVTRQWFSIRTPGSASVLVDAVAAGALFESDGSGRAPAQAGSGGEGQELRVLEAARHSRKLRRGTHRANAFQVTLRDVASGHAPPGALEARLDALRAHGFPNYLGPQRFGRDGRNLERARAWFRKPRRRVSRQQRSLWLSAARSHLFNQVCAARVEEGSWASLMVGEPVSLDGSRAFFRPDPDARPDAASSEAVARESLNQRLVCGDVHPSGPWWGRGQTHATDACAEFETRLLADLGEFRQGLENAGLEQERRALRALPRELSLLRLAGGDLQLNFTLAPGTFATMLLGELGPCARAETN